MDTKIESNSLERIVRLTLEKWYIAVACILVCIIAVITYISFATTDNFQAYTTMYVTNTSTYVNSTTGAATGTGTNTGELVVNEMLAKDYKQIAISDSVLSKASENLNKIPIDKQNISIIAFPDTRVLKLAVISGDASKASLIANEITDCLIEKIRELTGNDNIKIIDKAAVPQAPISMPIQKYLILAVILGIIINIIIVLLFEIFDTKVKGPEDLKERFNIPILALIPKYDDNGVATTNKAQKRRHDKDDSKQETF